MENEEWRMKNESQRINAECRTMKLERREAAGLPDFSS